MVALKITWNLISSSLCPFSWLLQNIVLSRCSFVASLVDCQYTYLYYYSQIFLWWSLLLINYLNDTLTIHFPHSLHEVMWVLETNKAVPFRLFRVFVPDYFGFEKWRILGERPCQSIIVHIITKIPTEDTKVIYNKINNYDISSIGYTRYTNNNNYWLLWDWLWRQQRSTKMQFHVKLHAYYQNECKAKFLLAGNYTYLFRVSRDH